jgi:hypothetical protein
MQVSESLIIRSRNSLATSCNGYMSSLNYYDPGIAIVRIVQSEPSDWTGLNSKEVWTRLDWTGSSFGLDWTGLKCLRTGLD